MGVRNRVRKNMERSVLRGLVFHYSPCSTLDKIHSPPRTRLSSLDLMPVYQPSAEDIGRSEQLDECIALLSPIEPRISQRTALRLVRTDHGTKITDRTYVPETNTAFHLLMRSG